jgi:hypothetical protein
MRARSIKPGICDNELLGTADPFCTLLFERLWMMADRAGRLEDRPLRIKAQAFPYREGLDIHQLLNWLSENGFILRYAVAGVAYIQVTKFTEHQSPHIKEAPSKIPAPDSPGASTIQAPCSTPPIPAPAALTPSSLTPDSGLLTPDSSSLRSLEDRRTTRAAAEPAEFTSIRQEYPRRSGGQRWGDALKFYLRRVGEGAKPEDILAGVRRYAVFTRATGIERTEKVQQAATFLGDNRGYLELWQPPPRALSAVERIQSRMRNGNGDERVVSEQSGGAGLEPISRMLR